MTDPAAPQRRVVWLHTAFPLGLSIGIGLFLLATNHHIPFANAGNCDPWHYFGRFFIQDQVPMMGPTRAGGRMPGTLPGYLLTRIFHGVQADYANFLLWYVAAIVSVYAAARKLFGVTPAVFAALFFATEPLIVGDYSVTYTAPAVTYCALTIAFAIYAANAQRPSAAVLLTLVTGFFWGTSIHAHLYSLSYSLITPLYCLTWTKKSGAAYVREFVWKFALLAVGAAFATVFFGLVSVLFLHGSFAFWSRQYADAFTALVVEYQKANWYLLGGRAALLILGAAACAVSAITVVRGRFSEASRRNILTALVPFAVLELAQIGYTIHGGITLEYDYYIVWLIAPLSLLLASCVSSAALRPGQKLAAVGIFGVLALAGDFGRLDLLWQGATAIPPSLVLSVLFAILLFFLPREPGRLLLVTLIVVAAIGATTRPEKVGLPVWEGESAHDVYVRAREGMEFVSTFHFPKRPRFWVNTSGTWGWQTIAIPRSYDYCVIDTALPAFLPSTNPAYNADAEAFSPGDYLVMTPKDASDLKLALANLAKRGLRFREMGQRNVWFNGDGYLVVVGRLS